MKRLFIAAITTVMLLGLSVSGCTEKEPPVTEPLPEEETVVSSCVTCHTDKEKLIEVAAPEEVKSEATSGEG